jgi:spore germination protein
MKQANHKQITPRQATAILVNILLSGHLLILPREISETAGTSSWLVLIVGGLAVLALTYIYTTLGRRFGKSSLPQYSVKTLGPFFGGALALLFAASWLVMAALASRLFSAVIITSILPRVPLENGILVMLLLGTHLSTQDVKTMARVHELLLPFIVGIITLSVIPAVSRVNVWRLLPLIDLDKLPSMGNGILVSITAFLSFELVAMFMPFYTNPEKAGHSHGVGIIAVTMIYLFVTMTTIGVLGQGDLSYSQWPTLELVRLVDFHGVFERLEAPFLALFVLVVFTSIGSLMYGTVSVLTDLFPIKSRFNWPYLLVIPAYYLALKPKSVIEVEHIAQVVLYIRLALVLTVPLILLPIATIRRKEDQAGDKQV